MSVIETCKCQTIATNFHRLKVVGRVSETQLQVGQIIVIKINFRQEENINVIT